MCGQNWVVPVPVPVETKPAEPLPWHHWSRSEEVDKDMAAWIYQEIGGRLGAKYGEVNSAVQQLIYERDQLKETLAAEQDHVRRLQEEIDQLGERRSDLIEVVRRLNEVVR
jgi:hypothetical protein